MGLVKNLALMAYISVGCSLSPILVSCRRKQEIVTLTTRRSTVLLGEGWEYEPEREEFWTWRVTAGPHEAIFVLSHLYDLAKSSSNFTNSGA